MSDHPTRKVDDLIAQRIIVDGVETFFTKEFYPAWLDFGTAPPDVGQKVAYQFPHEDGSGYSSGFGEVTEIRESAASEWIAQMIQSGSFPSMLDSHHITLELVCSFATAFEFGAQHLQPLPHGELATCDIDTFDHAPTVDNPVHLKATRTGLPLTDRVPISTAEQDKKFKEVAEEINNLLMQHYEDDLDLSMLFPIGRIVRASVTKSITEWRSFFCRYSVYYETLYLKTCVYDEFCRRIQGSFKCVFVGCDKCHDELSQYQEARGIKE